MSNTMTNNQYVLEMKTVQIAPMRTLMTALKDILLETNIVFSQDQYDSTGNLVSPAGIRIINMDKSHTILAHLFLDALKFEQFYCKYPKIIIGVNMFHLFKLINTIDNDDTLTIYIEEKDYADGIVEYLGLKFENGDIKQMKIQKLKLIEPDEEELDMPSVKFSSIINLPATDFQKIIRDLSNISERLEIKSIGSELVFSCTGPFATAQINRTESDGVTEFVKKTDTTNVIQGEFSLKNLGYFIKCTNLCSNIEMYLENDLPLVVKYAVASLGEIKLCLAPLPVS